MPKKMYKFGITDTSYPIVKIPQTILSTINSEITTEQIRKYLNLEYPTPKYIPAPFKPTRTKKVWKEKIKFEGNGCLLILAIPTFLLIFAMIIGGFRDGHPLLSILFIVILITMFSGLGAKIKNKPYSIYENISNEEFEKLLIKYEKDHMNMLSHNKSITQEIQREKNRIDNIISEQFETISSKIYHKELESLANIKKSTYSLNKGRSEVFFLSYLLKEFGNQISVDIEPEENEQRFKPDYVFICEKSNFHIDIEIDEPYSSENGKPIHNNRTYDNRRNLYFDSINWGVIRFSENQVIQFPNECCELIRNIILAIRKKELIFEHNVPITKLWSYEESLIMANNNYRNSYLPTELQIKNTKIRKNTESEEDRLPF